MFWRALAGYWYAGQVCAEYSVRDRELHDNDVVFDRDVHLCCATGAAWNVAPVVDNCMLSLLKRRLTL